MQNTSPAARWGGNSVHGFAPANTTSCATPSSDVKRASFGRIGPSPTRSTAASGTDRCTSGSARMSMSRPLRFTSRETHTITGRSPNPYISRTGRPSTDGLNA